MMLIPSSLRKPSVIGSFGALKASNLTKNFRNTLVSTVLSQPPLFVSPAQHDAPKVMVSEGPLVLPPKRGIIKQ